MADWKKHDTWSIVLLTIAASVPRFWGISALGINHFDAGAYALSSLAIFQGTVPAGLYPLQHFLSPPFFFGVSGVIMVVLGTASDLVPIALSALFGTLTIPLIYVAGRRWVGRSAATAAAILLAFSDFHILYSRTALTDVTFTFLFLLALFLFGETSRRKSFTLAVLAGAAVGLAWNTKYHGWLAVVVAAAALFVAALRGNNKQLVSGLSRLAVAACVAGLLYLPWVLFILTQDGGYDRLGAEHAEHFRPHAFLSHVVQHARAQLYLEGHLSRLAPLAALGGLLIARGPLVRADSVRVTLWATTSLLAGLALGETATAVLLAVLGAAVLARRRDYESWLLLAFFGCFSLLTPLYAPYARLLFPWLCAVFLLAGSGLRAAVGPARADRSEPTVRYGTSLSAGLIVLALSFASLLRRDIEPGSPFRRSDGFRVAASSLASTLSRDENVAVIGEPAVVYYLRRLQFESWHLDRPRQLHDHFREGDTVVVIVGRYGRLTGQFESWSKHAESVSELGRISVEVNDVRLLDDFSASSAQAYRRNPSRAYDLQVFRAVLPSR